MRVVAGSLEYAQARMQARRGQGPDEAAWRRLEVIREYPALLEAVRSTGLRHWIQEVAPAGDVHQIESTLRARWRAVAAETADWMPAAWHASVHWCATLADLPVLAHRMRGGEAWAWISADPVFGELQAAAVPVRPGAARESGLAELWRRADGDAGRLFGAWDALWRERMPAAGRRLEALDAVVRVFEGHVGRFRDATPADGWPLRRALQARLHLLFRRCALDPCAAFVHLALQALEAERLRGELLRRAAFPSMRVA